MHHYDSGCNVSWGLESESESTFFAQNQIPTPVNSMLYTLVGRQRGVSKSFIAIYQTVELYSEPITQAMVDSHVEKRNGENLSFEISIDPNHASLSGYTCFQNQYKNCIIALGYEHVLTWFEVSQQEISDSEFEQIITETIRAIDQRIYNYEINAKK